MSESVDDEKSESDILEDDEEKLVNLEDLSENESEKSDDEDEDEEELEIEEKPKKTGDRTFIPVDIRTQDHLNLFERAAVIKIRTAQINKEGGATYANNIREDSTAKEKAEQELNEGLRPIQVIRNIGTNFYVVK